MIPGATNLDLALHRLFETMATIEHERWSDWQSYLHGKIEREPAPGFLVLPPELVDGWNRQICTAYGDLSEREQNSDREQVLRSWSTVTDHVYSWLTESPFMYSFTSKESRYSIADAFVREMQRVEDAARSAIEAAQSDAEPVKATMDDVIKACSEKGYFWTFSQDRSETEILVWKEHERHTESWVTKYPNVDGACREALRYLASVT